jgi:DHA1 family bicyclomycin/chloramphenicol resistance-like MFS transporter
MAIISFSAMSSVFVSPTLPYIAQYFQIANNEVQNVITYFAIGYFTGQLIYAPLIKGFGVKKTLNFGILICFIGTLGSYISYLLHDFELLKYSRIITGIGSGSGFVTIYSTINNIYYEKDARKITSYTSLSFVLVPGLAMLISGVIVEHIGWQYCFLFLSLWCYILYLLGKTLPETIHDIDIANIKISTLIKNYYEVINIKILIYGLMYGSVASAFYIYTATAPLIIIGNMGQSPEYFSAHHLIIVIAYGLGGIFSAKTGHKYSSRQSIFLGCIIFSVSSIILSIMHQFNYLSLPILFFIIFGAIYFSVPLMFSNISVLLLSNSHEKSTVSSILGFLHLVPPLLFLNIMGTSTEPSKLLPFIMCMISVTLVVLNVISRRKPKEI